MSLLASKETREERLKHCLECPSLKKGFVFRCGECGCPVKSKIAVANSECPLKKWGPETAKPEDK